MTNKFKVVDYDIIYLSYDEPNAEKNYADLCKKVPWAKRVHGVKGSDAAHKACAELSETDRFITVDGDNIIRQDFLQQEIDFGEHTDLTNCVISWAGCNQINGLTYGNGGLKCWPKDFVLNMRTHEAADSNNKHAQVDFCWNAEYIQQNSCFSDIYNNETPQQAWRAGFREGVKMALDRGLKVSKEDFTKLPKKNIDRLHIWLMVGADVKNGEWSILGSRAGLYQTMFTDWNYVNVRDFEYLNNLWKDKFANFNKNEIHNESCKYTNLLSKELGLSIDDPLSPGQSKFFKSVYETPARNQKQKVIDIE